MLLLSQFLSPLSSTLEFLDGICECESGRGREGLVQLQSDTRSRLWILKVVNANQVDVSKEKKEGKSISSQAFFLSLSSPLPCCYVRG